MTNIKKERVKVSFEIELNKNTVLEDMEIEEKFEDFNVSNINVEYNKNHFEEKEE